MKHYNPRMLSFILAFGIFFTLSCNTLRNTESTDASDSDEVTLQEQISNINQEISEDPENAELQAEKANLLYRYSRDISNPDDRNPVYMNIKDIADRYSSNPTISKQMDEILSKAWRTEQQGGMHLLQNNESEQSQDVSRIVSHFENAITLIPDSLQTYSLLATTHYQHGDLNQAIETLEQAEGRKDQFNPSISEKLAYLYLEYGDLTEAEQRYSNLVEYNPEKLLYKHGLINVLMLSDQHDEAVEMLEQLSEEFPTRYAYQESLATELYYQFKNKTDAFTSSGTNNELTDEEQEELENLLSSVHSIFQTIRESLPSSEENLFRMASFYKNASTRLSQLSETNSDLEEIEQDFLEYSLPLWERLVDINSENVGYINNLYQVYLDLGMQEEAETIERSYNF